MVAVMWLTKNSKKSKNVSTRHHQQTKTSVCRLQCMVRGECFFKKIKIKNFFSSQGMQHCSTIGYGGNGV